MPAATAREATSPPGVTPRSSQTPSSWRPRLLVLTGIILLALNLRAAATAVSPVLDDVRSDLLLTTTGAGLLGLIPPFAFAVFGASTPLVIRRFGVERTAWVALGLAAAGQLLRAVAPEPLSFLVLSLVALGGMGMGNVVLPPLVKRYFPDRIGAVTGAYVVLLSVSTALAPLLAVPVADAAGWRVSIGQWGLFAVVAAVPWVVTSVRTPVPARGVVHDGPGPVVRTHVPLGATIRSPVAWGLAGLIGVTSLNTYAMFAWLPELLVDAGMDEATGGRMLALYAAVGIPTALLVPWLATRMRNPLPIVLASLVAYVVGYAGLALSPASLTVVWVVVAGLAPASFPLSLALVNLRSRTHAGSAALSGFSQGIGYTLAGLGPVVVAVLRESTGGWTVPLVFLAATLVVQVTGGAIVCRPRMFEDGLPPVRRGGGDVPHELPEPTS